MRVDLRGGAGVGCAGRLFGTLFGLAFLGFGLLFVVVIGREAWTDLQTRGWAATPCEIVASSASIDGPDERPYRFEVEYRYRFGGRWYHGRVYRRGYAGGSEYRPVQLLLLRYPIGARTTCWVDPGNPAGAILEHRSPFFGLLVLFPLVFVAIGLGALLSVWRQRKRPPAAVQLLGRGGGRAPKRRKAALVAAAVLLVAGAGGTIALLPWATGPIRARAWKEVEARVISSGVRRHESTDSNGHTSVTWKLDILYEYGLAGRTYRSNRWGWVTGSSSGRKSKAALARRHPRGSKLAVWVDPDDPTMALVRRGYSPGHLLLLIPLVMVGAGLLLFRWSRGTARPPAAAEAVVEEEENGGREPLVLRPGRGRLRGLLAAILFAVVWNGILSVFLHEMIEGFRTGRPDWFLTAFLTPFVLVGLLTIVLVVYTILGLANPTTVLTVTPPRPRLGEPFRVSWQTFGTAGRLDRLRITLEGSESATYRRGTDTRTDTEVFNRIPVAELSQAFEMRSGETTVRVPEDTMHTFHGQSNKVLWHVVVKGEIPRWPDVSDRWEIRVSPLATGGEGPWDS